VPKINKDVTIDGVNFRITPLGAVTAQAMLVRVTLGATTDNLKDTDITSVLSALVDNSKIEIVDKDGDGARNWVPLKTVYDDHFAGNLGAALEFQKAAFEVSFGSFLAVVRDLLQKRKELFGLISRMGAIGSSGDSSSAKG
jgi:tail assembly chaperone